MRALAKLERLHELAFQHLAVSLPQGSPLRQVQESGTSGIRLQNLRAQEVLHLVVAVKPGLRIHLHLLEANLALVP